MEIIGFIFGMGGMAYALMAYHRIGKLENELKRLGVLGGDFCSSREK